MAADKGRKRETGYRRGLWAEGLAAWYLRLKGYRILARRLKTPVGEIDILARKGRVLVAVEVKARPDLAAGLEAVRPKQRQRVVRALEWWLGSNEGAGLRDFDIRFDVLVVVPGRWPSHLPDAWRP